MTPQRCSDCGASLSAGGTCAHCGQVCANCRQPRRDHRLANYAEGLHVGGALLVCPLSLFYPCADGPLGPQAMSLGRRGGKVVSAVKAQAARENGKKGGRPRKETTAGARKPRPSTR